MIRRFALVIGVFLISIPAAAQMMEIRDLVQGTGRVAVSGDTVSVHYTGWLENGTEFDSSYPRGAPFTLEIGAGRVIEGWDYGLEGMRQGGLRQLVIPSRLGYGAQGTGGGAIPPHATLIFEIELIQIVTPAAGPDLQLSAPAVTDPGR